MNFIFNWLIKKLKETDKLERENKLSGYPQVETSKGSSGLDRPSNTFNIYKADGGHVVETYWYDKNHDRQIALYVVTPDQNLGERLSQILTFETIKR